MTNPLTLMFLSDGTVPVTASRGKNLLKSPVRRVFSGLALALIVGIPAWAALAPAPTPPYRDAVKLAALADTRIKESSGIAASRRTAGVYWTHNDSGEGPDLFAFDRKGQALASFSVTGATNVDWEDMAAGPGTGENAALYLGDIGDNSLKRTDTAVYKVWEPAVDVAKTGQSGRTMIAEKYPFMYPDGCHDAETLLVDPTNSDTYIVTKTDTGNSGLYKFPTPLVRNRTVTLEKVGTVRFTNPFRIRGRNMGKLATGGAFSPDGSRIFIRTYTDGLEWDRGPGQSVAAALAAEPRKVSVPWLGQFEAACYSEDGKAILLTAEGAPCPLYEIRAK
jgi:hypothetical protein